VDKNEIKEALRFARGSAVVVILGLFISFLFIVLMEKLHTYVSALMSWH